MTVNASGLVPVDLRILVKPDPVQEKIGSVYVPQQAQDKAKFAATMATFVSAGENAFIEWGDAARKPQPGDRVMYAQYSGATQKGADGEEYIFMTARDLLGIKEMSQ